MDGRLPFSLFLLLACFSSTIHYSFGEDLSLAISKFRNEKSSMMENFRERPSENSKMIVSRKENSPTAYSAAFLGPKNYSCYDFDETTNPSPNKTKRCSTCFVQLIADHDRLDQTPKFHAGCMPKYVDPPTAKPSITVIAMHDHGAKFAIAIFCFADHCNDNASIDDLRWKFERVKKKCSDSIRVLQPKERTDAFGSFKCYNNDTKKCDDHCNVDSGDGWCAQKWSNSVQEYCCVPKNSTEFMEQVTAELLDLTNPRGKIDAIEMHHEWDRWYLRETRCQQFDRCNLDRRPIRTTAQAVCQFWINHHHTEEERERKSMALYGRIGVSAGVFILVLIICSVVIFRCNVILIVYVGEKKKMKSTESTSGIKNSSSKSASGGEGEGKSSVDEKAAIYGSDPSTSSTTAAEFHSYEVVAGGTTRSEERSGSEEEYYFYA